MVKTDDLGDLAWLVGYNASPDGLPKDKPDSKLSYKKKSKKLAADVPSAMSGEERGHKPPFTYGELIEAALTDKGPLCLSDIYNWIRSKFSYYRDPINLGWQNGIRHRLSTTPRFVVSKRRGEPGKGGVWRIADESTLLRVKAEAAEKHHWKKQKLTEYETNSKFRVRRRRVPEPMEPHFDIESCDMESAEEDEPLQSTEANSLGRPIIPDGVIAMGLGRKTTTKDQPNKIHDIAVHPKTNTLNTIDVNQLYTPKDDANKENDAIHNVDEAENAVKLLKKFTDNMLDDEFIDVVNNSSDDDSKDGKTKADGEVEDEENPLPKSITKKTDKSNSDSKIKCDKPPSSVSMNEDAAAPRSNDANNKEDAASTLDASSKQDLVKHMAIELIKSITPKSRKTATDKGLSDESKHDTEKKEKKTPDNDCQTQEDTIPSEAEIDDLSGDEDDLISDESVHLDDTDDENLSTSVTHWKIQMEDDIELQDETIDKNNNSMMEPIKTPSEKNEDATKTKHINLEPKGDKVNPDGKSIVCSKLGSIVRFKVKNHKDVYKGQKFKVVPLKTPVTTNPSVDKATDVLSKWASEVEVKNQKIVDQFKENAKSKDPKTTSFGDFVTTPGIWTTITEPGKRDKICMNKKLLQKSKEKRKRKRSLSIGETSYNMKPGPIELHKRQSPCKFPKKTKPNIPAPRAVKSDGNLLQYASMSGDIPIIPKGLPALQTNWIPYSQHGYVPLQAQENVLAFMKNKTARKSKSNKVQGAQRSQSATYNGAEDATGNHHQRIMNPRANFTIATPMMPRSELSNIQSLLANKPSAVNYPSARYPRMLNTQNAPAPQGHLGNPYNTQTPQMSTAQHPVVQIYDHYSQSLLSPGGGDQPEIMSLVQKQNNYLCPQVYSKNNLPQNVHTMPQNPQIQNESNPPHGVLWSQGNEIHVPEVLQNTQKGYLALGPQVIQGTRKGKLTIQPQVPDNSQKGQITLGPEVLQNIHKGQLLLGSQKGLQTQGQGMQTTFNYEGCDVPVECTQGFYEGWCDPSMQYNGTPYNNTSFMSPTGFTGTGS
ncbi:unnamed protein product [Owenia fusiformis]|nr:unnamed protein product [Owenia fusiformis]